MADHKSTQITAMETLPIVRVSPTVSGGVVRYARGVVTVTTAMIDNADDNIFIVRLPSQAVPISVKMFNTDLDSNGSPALAANVGLWYGTGANAGTVIDADAFASAVTSLQAAVTSGTELMHEDVTPNPITDRGQTLWELGGLTSDPRCMIDIGLDISTAAATAATGTIVMEVLYIIN